MSTLAEMSTGSALTGASLQALLAGLVPALLARQGDALAVKDLASGRWVHANAAMAELLRRPLSELVGCTDAELFAPALATVLRAAEHTAQAQGEPMNSEHRVELHGQRREFAVLRWASPPDAQGRRFLCSVWADLAPERQREAQLRAALEQIEQQQRANDLLRSLFSWNPQAHRS